MRPLNVVLLAGVTTWIVAGCEKPAAKNATTQPAMQGRPSEIISKDAASSSDDSAAQPSVAPAENLALSEDTSANPLDLVTGKIDTTITLRIWLKSHPSDKVSEVPPVSGIDDPFCRGAVAQMHAMGRALTRYAMFYIPALSKEEQLPTDTAAAPGEYCELRTFVLVSEEMDSAHGEALRDSLASLIETRLGSHREGLPLGAGGVRGTREGKVWNGPGTKVIVAAGPVDKKQVDASRVTISEEPVVDTAKPLARAFAVAYAPGSGVQDFDTWESRYHNESTQRVADQPQRYRDIDSALVWAAAPSLTADLNTVLTFLKRHDPENNLEVRPTQVDAALVRALKTIHDAAPTLPPARRAAALIAGEVTLLDSFGARAADSNKKVLHTLDSLGIYFGPDSGLKNMHRWLWQAWEIDSTGRAGHVAFLRLLALGWPASNECNGDEYVPIIREGEAALKRGDKNPAIYFYVGSAYKAIYDFAHFENEEVGPSQDVKNQAESARLKGIEYFRAAVQSLPEGEMRRDAWAKGMRLMMRRTGEQPEYVCFPD